MHGFEELGLSNTWIAQKEDVYVAPDTVSALHYPLDAAEHGHSECALDVVVTVDGRSYGLVDDLVQVLSLGKFEYFLLHLLVQVVLVAVQHLGDRIGLNERDEEGKALPDVQVALVSVHVDAGHFDVVARTGYVYVVSEKHYFLATGDSSGQYFRGGLLQRDFLIIAIDGLLLVDGEGTVGLARSAASQSNVVNAVDVEWSLQETALNALVYNLLQLTENLTSNGHNSLDYIERAILLMSLPRWACRRSLM